MAEDQVGDPVTIDRSMLLLAISTFDRLQHYIDGVLTVAGKHGVGPQRALEDADIISAMRLLFRTAGLLAEPSGAAGIAAIQTHPNRFRGRRVATVICGSNLTEEQVKAWLG